MPLGATNILTKTLGGHQSAYQCALCQCITQTTICSCQPRLGGLRVAGMCCANQEAHGQTAQTWFNTSVRSEQGSLPTLQQDLQHTASLVLWHKHGEIFSSRQMQGY